MSASPCGGSGRERERLKQELINHKSMMILFSLKVSRSFNLIQYILYSIYIYIIYIQFNSIQYMPQYILEGVSIKSEINIQLYISTCIKRSMHLHDDICFMKYL